jgi:hypothetical protein
LVSNYHGSGIVVTLPVDVSAFGFDLFSVVSGNAAGTNQDSVDVTVAGQKYVVQTPAAPGLYQIDFQVPNGIAGNDVPVAVSIGGTRSTHAPSRFVKRGDSKMRWTCPHRCGLPAIMPIARLLGLAVCFSARAHKGTAAPLF